MNQHVILPSLHLERSSLLVPSLLHATTLSGLSVAYVCATWVTNVSTTNKQNNNNSTETPLQPFYIDSYTLDFLFLQHNRQPSTCSALYARPSARYGTMPEQTATRKKKDPSKLSDTPAARAKRDERAVIKKTIALSQEEPAKRSRESWARRTDERKAEVKQYDANRYALKKARKDTEKQDGFQDLSEEEQHKLLADVEARVRQER
jgi:hypothetical protein